MNLKKRMLLPCLFLGLGLQGNAQQAAVASGGEATGSSGSVSYSIGQTFYTSQSGTSGSNAMGVQQPIEVSDLDNNNFSSVNLEIKVYPNPIASFVNLDIKDVSEKLSFELYDLHGRLIGSQNLQENVTKIDMAALPSAVYLLVVKKDDMQVKNFKLIKKD